MAEQTYGGFWIRVLAYLVDSVVLFSAFMVLGFGAGFLGEVGIKLLPILCLLTSILYWALMQASARQATIGKALLGMKVTDIAGERISILRSVGRELAKIASGIPLGLGYVMAAFTGRKQALHDMVAATTVVRDSSGHVLIALLVGVFGWIVPGALAMFIGGALIAVMMGTMGGDVFQKAMTDSPKRVAATSAPKSAAVPARPAPAARNPAPVATPPVTAAGADAETILAAQLEGFEKPGTTRAGPAVLEFDKDFLFGSNFSIKAYLPPLRELQGKSISLQITRVIDAKGVDVYDAASSFEKDTFFNTMDMAPAPSPVSHLAGKRRVHLKSGNDAKNLERAEGVVKLSVAQRPAVATFGATEAGKSQTVHGVGIVLTALKGKQVELEFTGDQGRVLSTTGFGADQKPLRIESSGASGSSSFYTFNEPPERIELMVAESTVKRDFPFTLTRTSVAAPPAAAVAAAPPAAAPKPAEAVAPAKPVAVTPVAMAKEAPPAPVAKAAPAEPKLPVRVDSPRAPERPSQPGPKYNDVMSAVMSGDSAGVNELLALGRWPDKPDSYGVTPLTTAAVRGDRASAELLLKAGADPYPALLAARKRGDGEMTSLLERYSATSKRP